MASEAFPCAARVLPRSFSNTATRGDRSSFLASVNALVKNWSAIPSLACAAWVQLAAAFDRAPAARYDAAVRLAARASSSAKGAPLGAALAANSDGLGAGPAVAAGPIERRLKPTPDARAITQRRRGCK